MKAWLSNKLALGVALLAVSLFGCTRRGGEQGTLVTTANAEPVIPAYTQVDAATQANEPVIEQTADPAPPPPPNAPDPAAVVAVPAPGADKNPLPSTVRQTGPAADVMKMAQSGVDEAIMLSFITNTSSPFGLTSDEIIYMNDLGIPSSIVSAMIQRDQTMKEFWAQNAKEQAAPPPATGAAPSYVNEPQPQPQSAPVEAPLTPPATASTDGFYDSLSPYGTWIEAEGYGRVWQPTVVVANRSWAPYCDRGRWVYSDCGWYWMSDYSWGATTFHYGRWFSHPRWGWCWWPDTVWAPSWVSWRYSGDYCGWAPLPPAAYYRPGFGFSYYNRSVGFSFGFGLTSSCYTFVNWRNVCDPHPYNHRVARSQVTQVFNNTTIVNNYGNGNNNTVINRGISVDRVRERSRTEIRQVNIRESSAPARGGRLEHFDRDGKTLVVNRREAARPTLPASAHNNNTPGNRTTDRTRSDSPLAPAGTTANHQANPGVRVPNRDIRQSPTATQPSGRAAGDNTTANRNFPSRENRSDTTGRDVKREPTAPVVVSPRNSPTTPVTPPNGRAAGQNNNRGNNTRNNIQAQDNSRNDAPGREVTREPSSPVIVSPRNSPPAAPTVNNRVTPTPTPRIEAQPRRDTRPNSSAAESKPNPIVVVGRPQNNDPAGRSANVPNRNEAMTRRQQPDAVPTIPPSTAPVRMNPQFQTQSPSTINSPRVERREADRTSFDTPRPSYTAPRSVPQTAPVYSAPRTPAPQVSTPQLGIPIPRQAPAPQSSPAISSPRSEVRSAPQAPAQSRSETVRGNSGGNNGGGNGGGRDNRRQ